MITHGRDSLDAEKSAPYFQDQPSLTRYLRDVTRDSHRATEELIGFDGIAKGAIFFRSFLWTMLDFHSWIERDALPVARATLGLRNDALLDRSRLIRLDLTAMGFPVSESASTQSGLLANPLGVVELDNEGEALGAAYVCAGSALGARHIRRHLLRNGNARTRSGIPLPDRYLTCGDADVTSLWRDFVTRLDSYGATCGTFNDVAIGADKAFTQVRTAHTFATLAYDLNST